MNIMGTATDTILRRAAKLAALAKAGGTQAEADTAAEALARLMRDHHLSMADIQTTPEAIGVAEIDHLTEWRKAPLWSLTLAGGVAAALNAHVIKGHHRQGSRDFFRFIGEGTDASVCAYWYAAMTSTLPTIARRAQVPRAYRNDYLRGVAIRVSERLRDLLAPRPDQVAARGLVVVKAAATRRFMEAHYPKLEQAEVSECQHQAAVATGYRAGDRVPLQQGLAAAEQPGRLGATA